MKSAFDAEIAELNKKCWGKEKRGPRTICIGTDAEFARLKVLDNLQYYEVTDAPAKYGYELYRNRGSDNAFWMRYLKGKFVVELVQDYYHKPSYDRVYKTFPGTKAGYHEAAEYFYNVQ